MATLKTTSGEEFIVDDDVVSSICRFAWKLDKDGYVYRKTTINGKKGRSVRLHRVVFSETDPLVCVDHINGNKLDNRRSNLRRSTKMQNSQNRQKNGGTSSLYRGVTWSSSARKWQAQIVSGNKREYIGVFDDEHVAAHEYNKRAIQLHGEFARLNPIGYAEERGTLKGGA